jgi:hypothetical protein
VSRAALATLGRPGPAWPRSVARWATNGLVAAEVTTCLSAEELHSILASTALDLVVAEVGVTGVDRVLADEVRRAQVALALVTAGRTTSAAAHLEPDALLEPDFGPERLAAVLRAHARSRPAPPPSTLADDRPMGRMIVSTGPGGAGASTVAQALATHAARFGRVALADLALDADQHVRHGVDPGCDGVFELADALRHRRGIDLTPPVLHQAPGYDLLCGLRRRQEWTVLTPTTAGDLVDLLLRTYPLVVADVTPEVDGQADTGSTDLEERNALSRAALTRAEVVVVVGRWSTTGVHRLARTLADLVRHGVTAERLAPVLNGAPRSGARAAQRVLEATASDPGWARPLGLPHDRRVEPALREARPLPRQLVDRVGALLS